MKRTFICMAVLLGALFLSVGCSTTSKSSTATSSTTEPATTTTHDIYTPAVAAPQ